ncbi:MAG: 50S ribosomal protein L23 [Deltaproteobacteria bacterium]|jgi:large subunit ribosomal protein L23|nr:50S ribosomal protein L23 [Deltaproteobacteria bacterium]
MDYTQIILKPIVTEKSSAMREEYNQAAFLVAPGAGKIDIKNAVEAAFKVKVLGVNVVVSKPKAKTRQGRTVGKSAGCKKAYVSLAQGEKIEFFEGV